MKKIYSFVLLSLMTVSMLAQAPVGYYNGTAGLTGQQLKTTLSQIISNGHVDYGYSGLWAAYESTDRDKYYENDNTILDIYSENVAGADPYNYTYSSDQCGGNTPANEGGCYNREHIVPQSMFGSAAPMVSDIHFIRPTDSKVNGWRSNYPFGMVSSATVTTLNGSKLGASGSSGYSGTVFEPADAFKGDVARMVFYFVTRYESQLSNFGSSSMLGGSAYPGLQDWELQQLLIWNSQDPVSAAEIDRNNKSQTYQGNRNPFIDNANWANDIWGTPDTAAPTSPTSLTVTGTTSNSVSLSWAAATDNVAVTSYDIYVNGVYTITVTGTTATVSGLSASTTYTFHIIAKDMAGNASPQSNTATGTTTAGGSTGGSCGTETFENIPANSSSYSTNTWTANGIDWTATDSRTDGTINSRAITIRNGSLTSSQISGGISSLTVTAKPMFTATAGAFNLLINGVSVGTIPYNAQATGAPGAAITTTINNINVTGNIVIALQQPVSGNRIGLDDLSWTCYSLSTNESSAEKGVSIYPNPVRDGKLFVNGKGLGEIKSAKIYSLDGRTVKTFANPFRNAEYLDVSSLPSGIYILNAGSIAEKFIIKKY